MGLNKRRTMEKQRAGSLRHKKNMEKFIGPYDCPKCFSPKSITIEKFVKTPETITWFAQCSKCGVWKKIELPAIWQKIDVINKVTDILREEGEIV
jgi:transcription elongation factor Elf1